MFPGLLFENCHITPVISGDANSTRAGDRVSMENYHRCLFLLTQYQGGAGTVNITIDLDTAAAGSSESAGRTITNWWYATDITVGTTADTWTKGAAAASIATSNSSSGTSYYAIEWDAADCNVSGTNYPFVEFNCSNGSQASNILVCNAFLYEPRYAEDLTPTAQS